MTAKQVAAIIASSLLISLHIAIERGELVAENLEAIDRAAGNNAASVLLTDPIEQEEGIL